MAALGLLKPDNAGCNSTLNPPMPDALDFGIAKRRLEEDDSEGAMVMLKGATDAAKTAANNTTTTRQLVGLLLDNSLDVEM